MSKSYFFLGAIVGGKKDEEEKEHRRITKGDDFYLEGGNKEVHEEVAEKYIKLSEKVKGKDIPKKEIRMMMEDMFK